MATLEELEKRVRDSGELCDRLAECRRRLGDMCGEHRGPRMTIPVAWYDDDFFIGVTLQDAIDALNAGSNAGGKAPQPEQ